MKLARRVRERAIDLVRDSFVTHMARSIAPESYSRLRNYYAVKAKAERGHTLVDEQELQREYRRAVRWIKDHLPPDDVGDYLEFGVFYGMSLACMHRVLDEAGLDQPRLFGFDSFEGLPEPGDPDDRRWRRGQFTSSYAFAREYLTGQHVDWHRVFLVRGWFDQTLTDALVRKHDIRKASLIMVDCDMYRSAKDALAFCAPLIKDHAIVFFDDWNAARLADRNQGEKRAFDEFLSQNPHLTAEAFGSYAYHGRPNAKVFRVSVSEAWDDGG